MLPNYDKGRQSAVLGSAFGEFRLGFGLRGLGFTGLGVWGLEVQGFRGLEFEFAGHEPTNLPWCPCSLLPPSAKTKTRNSLPLNKKTHSIIQT